MLSVLLGDRECKDDAGQIFLHINYQSAVRANKKHRRQLQKTKVSRFCNRITISPTDLVDVHCLHAEHADSAAEGEEQDRRLHSDPPYKIKDKANRQPKVLQNFLPDILHY